MNLRKERIRQRARQIFAQEGEEDGGQIWQYWKAAEKEITYEELMAADPSFARTIH